jgi:hypothetical protein
MKELPKPRAEHPFPLGYPLILDVSEITTFLKKLNETDFRNDVTLSTRFYSEEPHKGKWHVELYASNSQVFPVHRQRIASIISEVFYGKDLTPFGQKERI